MVAEVGMGSVVGVVAMVEAGQVVVSVAAVVLGEVKAVASTWPACPGTAPEPVTH
jgi:hypothetical protein